MRARQDGGGLDTKYVRTGRGTYYIQPIERVIQRSWGPAATVDTPRYYGSLPGTESRASPMTDDRCDSIVFVRMNGHINGAGAGDRGMCQTPRFGLPPSSILLVGPEVPSTGSDRMPPMSF